MIALVDRALALNPNFAHGWFISGILRTWAGQPDLGIGHVEASLRLSPRVRVSTALVALGLAHFLGRQFDRAVPKLLLAIQEDPSLPVPYRYLAACYAQMGRLDEARADRRAVARDDPSRDTRRQLSAERQAPRTLRVGPASGGGRGGMSQTRRLAAILAADVAGYSRLMGRTRKARSNASKRCAARSSTRRSPSTTAASRLDSGTKTVGDGVNIVYSPSIGSERTRIRESSSTAMHPCCNAASKIGKLATSNTVCRSGCLPRSCLKGRLTVRAPAATRAAYRSRCPPR